MELCTADRAPARPTENRKARVMIVEDSRVVREFLRTLIGLDPRLEVVACVESGEDALRMLPRVVPDVISLDIRLPGMNGLEITRRVMAEQPTPIVVVSASVEAADLNISISALRAGALSVVEKPVHVSHADYQRLAHRLCTQLALMSQVKVVRQRIARDGQSDGKRLTKPPARPPQTPLGGPASYQVLGLTASTGGPSALQRVLGDLEADFPLPVVVVQHIADGFNAGFISWLGSVTPLPVKQALDGEVLCRGNVYVSPADQHLRVEGSRLRLDHGPVLSGQRPSGTVLFESMAQSLGQAALAVLLTGMGDDGAAGLKRVFDAGGYTLVEDESTAVVYGMPKAAVELGAAHEILPLHKIGARITELARLTAGCPLAMPTRGTANTSSQAQP